MREHQRANLAHEHVSQVAREGDLKQYKICVNQLIALTKQSGLVQALEFMYGIDGDKGRVARILLFHLAAQLSNSYSKIKDVDGLRRHAREERDLSRFMQLSRDVVSTLVWYRRFNQSARAHEEA